jgi:hypothetical protein
MEIKMVNIKTLWIPIFFLSVPSIAMAGAYRYQDENGQTVYSQTPPADKDAQVIKPPPPPSSSAVAEKTAIEKNITTEKAKEEKVKEDQHEIDASKLTEEEKRMNCEKAKKYLGELQLKARIKLIGPDGQATMLTEDQKNAEITKTKGMIKSFCTQPTI